MINALVIGWRTLVRRHGRLALFIAAVTVAAAVLIDMVMLAAGLQRSLTDLLEATGYQVRVLPKGVLPFETEVALLGSDSLAEQLRADPRIDEATPIWARTVYVARTEEASRPEATFGYGLPAGTTPALRLVAGRPAEAAGEVIVDSRLAADLGLMPGSRLEIGLEPDAALGAMRRQRAARVVGVAEFMFAAEGSATIGMTIEDLWNLAGTSSRPAAMIALRVARDADAYGVARDYRDRLGYLDVYAIPEIIEAAGDRLTYFQQLSLVLGTVSLGVAFLLVATLLTLSVNERWGEIAALRALGVTRGRMLAQVAWQGLIISASGTAAGISVGLIVARYLDGILTRFPGLPLDVSFFILEPFDAGLSATLLLATGLLAGLYPAWRAASVNIALVLRQEIE